jgi:hypothetical protein
MSQPSLSDPQAARTAIVVEWAPFRLAAGATEAALLAASEDLQVGFLAKQPGFLRRDLLRDADDGWADLVVWADAASATAAIERADKSPVCFAYFQLMQSEESADPSHALRLLRRVKSY